MNAKAMTNKALLMTLLGGYGESLSKMPLSEVFGFTAPRQATLTMMNETAAEYVVFPQIAAAKELMRRACEEHLQDAPVMSAPEVVKDFLRTIFAGKEKEVFVCMWLDTQYKLIACDEMFNGTLSETSVYPREVVKRALHHNAGAVMIAHNHPSGNATPSTADKMLTQRLKEALSMVGVRLLDHFVVAGVSITSFAESGAL